MVRCWGGEQHTLGADAGGARRLWVCTGGLFARGVYSSEKQTCMCSRNARVTRPVLADRQIPETLTKRRRPWKCD